jgi:hypothetical protein
MDRNLNSRFLAFLLLVAPLLFEDLSVTLDSVFRPSLALMA